MFFDVAPERLPDAMADSDTERLSTFDKLPLATVDSDVALDVLAERLVEICVEPDVARESEAERSNSFISSNASFWVSSFPSRSMNLGMVFS